MLEKILVCLDGSKAAEQILPYITGDTKFIGSKLVLLRAVSLPGFSLPLSVPGEPGVPVSTGADIKHMEAKEDEAGAYLQTQTALLRQKGFDVDYAAVPGTAGEIIVHYAEENEITLIAIATHGHNVARRFFVGSTADYVVRHSIIPVLIIRPQ